MDLEQFKELIKKQQAGILTQAEQEVLNTFEDHLFRKNKNKVFRDDLHLQTVKQSLSKKIEAKTSIRHTAYWMKIAASMVFFIGVSYLVYHAITAPRKVIVVNQQSSPKDIELSDGSTITLNENSELIYWEDFNRGNRNVELAGEAFFDIASNKQIPFIVQSGKLSTMVVGTAFNIKEAAHQVSVTVSEGQVKVYHQEDTLKVIPNEQVNFDTRTEKLNKQQVNAMLHNIWHKEEIELNDVLLEEVTEVFNRLYKITPLFINEADRKLRMSLSFNKNEDLQSIIDRINLTNEVKLEIENDMLKITH